MKRVFFGVCVSIFTAMATLPVTGITLEWDQTLRMALEADERIEIQRREAVIAGEDVNRAWTIISPRLLANATYDRPDEEIRQEGEIIVPEDSWRVTLVASQPLFDARVLPARRLGLAIEAAELQLLAHAIRSSLFEVSTAFYGVLSAQKQLEIAEETQALAMREVERAKARFDAGEARRTEFLRAEVDEARANRNLVAARNALNVARSALARRIGLDADENFTVVAPPLSPDTELADLEQLYLQALQDRNDLAAARLLVESAEENAVVIQRENWPTLDLQYRHHFVDPETLTSQNNAWDISAIARFEFWDGGSRRISRRQQEERIQQADLRVRDLEKTIQLEVQQALLDLRTLTENLTTLNKEVRLAEENYRTLSEQARVGLATSLDVSTALNALNQARTELARQEFDYEVAKQALQLALGRYADHLIEVAE
jgi:outer membrane protein